MKNENQAKMVKRSYWKTCNKMVDRAAAKQSINEQCKTNVGLPRSYAKRLLKQEAIERWYDQWDGPSMFRVPTCTKSLYAYAVIRPLANSAIGES